MQAKPYRALLALAVLALAPSTASAVQLGVEDDSPNAPVVSSAAAIDGGWVRYITYIDQPGIAQRIRTAHGAGLKVILTVGGTGTRSRLPSFKLALRYISSLPRADRYTIDNEPDIDGTKPCVYRRGWMLARKTLGAKLLFGDFSPHAPLSYTAALRKCGRLPKHVGFALHPYQWDDPLAPATVQGGIGNLQTMRRALHGMGVSVDWWLDEYGYRSINVSESQAAAWWPRAIRQAKRNHARVLIAYLGNHPLWNTRPGALQWCALSAGRYCPATDDHRQPVTVPPSMPLRQVHAHPTVDEMLAYAG